MIEQEFTATAEARPGGGIAIRLPFDPAVAWGERQRYDVTGTVNGHRMRGKLALRPGGHVLELGPTWCRDASVALGAQVWFCWIDDAMRPATRAKRIAETIAALKSGKRER